MTVVHDDQLFAELARLSRQGSGAPAAADAAKYPGSSYYDTAAQTLYLSDGTGWIVMAEPTQTFATAVTSVTGTITTLGVVTMTYRRHDGWLSWNLSITITTNGTGAGAVRFTLPKNASAAWAACGRETALTGSLLSVTGGLATADIATYNNAYPGGNGAVLLCSGQYQMTTRYS